MNTLNTLIVAICLAPFAATHAQTEIQPNRPPGIAPTLGVFHGPDGSGHKPILALTVKNIDYPHGCFSDLAHHYRAHVEGKDGEPEKTEEYRHLLGDFRLGDGPDLMDNAMVCFPFLPGCSFDKFFPLSTFYDLKAAGKYAVYMEVFDEAANSSKEPAVWRRTNTVQFEIKPNGQLVY